MNSYAFKRSYKREKVTATKSRNASMVSGKMPQEKSPPEKMPPRKFHPGNKPPKKIAPRKNTFQENWPPDICPPSPKEKKENKRKLAPENIIF